MSAARLERAKRRFGNQCGRGVVVVRLLHVPRDGELPYDVRARMRVAAAVAVAAGLASRAHWDCHRAHPQRVEAAAAAAAREAARDAAHVTAAEIAAEPEMEQYRLEMRPDGQTLSATVVNTVTATLLTGSNAQVPWLEHAHWRKMTMPPKAIHRGLLGLACPYAASQNRSFRLRYAAPVCSRHSLHPFEMTIQATASRNDLLGDFSQHTTVALLRAALGLGRELRTVSSRCRNRVFVTYMHRPVDFARLLHRHKAVAQHEGMFESVICKHGSLKGVRLLVFKTPLVLVGTKSLQQMYQAMALFMPAVLDSLWPNAVPPPMRRRPRPPGETSDDDGRARKQRRAAVDDSCQCFIEFLSF